MDNSQMPPVQPTPQGPQPLGQSATGVTGVTSAAGMEQGVLVAPVQPGATGVTGATSVQPATASVQAPGQPAGQPGQPSGPLTSATTDAGGKKTPKKQVNKGKLAMILMGISVGILLVLAVAFIVLYVLKDNEYADLKDNTDIMIEKAISDAKTEQALADAEEAKKDTRQFTGPSDYGQVSFDYPKLWSLFVEADASKGGDFVAYFNPIEIEPVSPSTVYALRMNIQNRTYETVLAEYQGYLDRGFLSMETITVDSNTAVKYTGTIPGTELKGMIVIFKVRDKTVFLRTDSMLFEKDFDKILASVKYQP